MENENLESSFLLGKLESQYNEDEFEKIKNGFLQNHSVTLRVNTLKSNIEKVTKVLTENKISFEKLNFYENAFILHNCNEEQIKNLEIFTSGEIYLQSLSSMLPIIVMQPKENVDILDMCAAPGGKTTLISALTNKKARITAVEMNFARTQTLLHNIKLLGATNVYVLNQNACQLDDLLKFDSILLDTPCSGSGTIKLYNENSFKYIDQTFLNNCVKSQKKLISKAIKLIKKNQEIIYSTCSLFKEENEDIINYALSSKQVELVSINVDNLTEIPKLSSELLGVLKVCPTQNFEGFFVAKLRKI